VPGDTYTSYRMHNGMVVVAEAIPSVRSAAFVFLLPAGAVTDPSEMLGAATVLEGFCYRGAGDLDTRGLSDALDSLGMQRGGGAELETVSFGGALLADNLEAALALYADILRRPRLPEEEFEAERELALQRLERLQDNPTEKLFIELRNAYFPGAHGRTAYGTEEGLRALTAESLRDQHRRLYRPDGAILAVAGRFNLQDLHAALEELFGDWNGSGPPLPEPTTGGRERYRHAWQETAQEQIGVAYPTAALGEDGYYDARMAVEVLSGGMSARLFTEVREKRGLCYSVRAMHTNARHTGAVFAYAGTTPERSQETLDVLIYELQRIQQGVGDEELARARTGLLAALIMQSEATRARAAFLARDQYLIGQVRTLGEIREAIEGVTPESIMDTLRRLPARDFTVVTLGPAELKVKE
jgi:predicted Zn-dependent peptidase